MAVTLEVGAVQHYRCLSTDQKPGIFAEEIGAEVQKPRQGSTLTEVDTGRRFIFRQGEWVIQKQTIEALLQELIELNREVLAVLRATHAGHEEHLWEEDVEIDEVA